MKAFSRQLLSDLFLVAVLAIFSISVALLTKGGDPKPASQPVTGSTPDTEQTTPEKTRSLDIKSPEDDPLISTFMVSSTGRFIPHPPLDLDQFKQYIKWGKGIVIDVRTEKEYQKGHIPNSTWVPVSKFKEHYAALEKELSPYKKQLIVIYCGNRYCGTGDDAQQQFINQGFKYVGIYSGGYLEWEGKGEPVE